MKMNPLAHTRKKTEIHMHHTHTHVYCSPHVNRDKSDRFLAMQIQIYIQPHI